MSQRKTLHTKAHKPLSHSSYYKSTCTGALVILGSKGDRQIKQSRLGVVSTLASPVRESDGSRVTNNVYSAGDGEVQGGCMRSAVYEGTCNVSSEKNCSGPKTCRERSQF